MKLNDTDKNVQYKLAGARTCDVPHETDPKWTL